MPAWPPGVALAAGLQNTCIAPALVAAYCATEYRVLGNPGFILRIGQASPALQALLREGHCHGAAFITAFNPGSEPADAVANARAHALLLAELQGGRWTVLPACGASPAGGWVEPGVLVPGLSRDDAIRLGRQFRQNAIVWCSEAAIPELVLLR